MEKYRIRLDNGRVVGPLSLSQVKELFAKGHISGSEQCQLFPVGDWKKIADFPDIKLEKVDLASSEKTFVRKLDEIMLNDQGEVEEKVFPEKFQFDKRTPFSEDMGPVDTEDVSVEIIESEKSQATDDVTTEQGHVAENSDRPRFG